MDKVQHSIELIKNAEKLALTYNDFGFHLAFSGGKDSQVIYELAKMAGVKFKAYFYKTSVDPRELLSFIRSNYPGVEWVRPVMTMYELIYKNGSLPLRQHRFCCKYLKERNGINAVVMTGITKAESNRRAKRKEQEHSCVKGQDKIFIHPIFDWTKAEVLQFLKNRNIAKCSLYDIQERIGCVGCPMSPKTMRRDFRNMPNFKKAYINTVQRLIDEKGKYSEFPSAEDVVDWWASGMSRKQWLANKLQYTIEYAEQSSEY
jgi:phosphoadenosine phosphosulfate reductase